MITSAIKTTSETIDRAQIEALKKLDLAALIESETRPSESRDRRFPATVRLVAIVEYDGSDFSGFQRQPNTRTVQGVLERAVVGLFGDERILIVPAGRTDAGVHASGQVVHAELPKPNRIPLESLSHALNLRLPSDVRISESTILETDFHARFSAIGREYQYVIEFLPSVFSNRFAWQTHLTETVENLNSIAEIFIGTHDFSGLSKVNHDVKNYRCTVESCSWVGTERSLEFRIKANRFVYGMVRTLVGVMVAVAQKKRTVEEIHIALATGSKELATLLAPPNGLTLARVCYPRNYQLLEGLKDEVSVQ